jgi:RNA polymerase sigma-70 factor (ECF subfamily)
VRSHRLRAVEPTPSVDLPGRPGEPLQVDQVFRDHVSYVAAIALRLLNNEDETDDLIQDVFVVAAEGLHRLREPGAVKGWLASITVRLALRRLRRRRFLRFFTSGAPEELQAVATRSGDPEDRLLLREVYATLDEIPAAQRVAWVLRHLEGETVDRVAMLCGCSLATAKRRIADAHDRIRKLVPDG